MFGTKTITKIGDAAGIVLDAALLQRAGLRIGGQVAVALDERGAIVLTPLRPAIAEEAAPKIWRRAS